jgi:hypothetical protein
MDEAALSQNIEEFGFIGAHMRAVSLPCGAWCNRSGK